MVRKGTRRRPSRLRAAAADDFRRPRGGGSRARRPGLARPPQPVHDVHGALAGGCCSDAAAAQARRIPQARAETVSQVNTSL